MEEVMEKVAISVAAALILGLISLLSTRFRGLLFYNRVEYELSYTKGMGEVEWDIEWEGFRLTIKAQDVSNDHLSDVILERNQRKPVSIPRLEPSDRFQSLFDGEIQMKLNSIVRRRVDAEVNYILRFVFRRRWL